MLCSIGLLTLSTILRRSTLLDTNSSLALYIIKLHLPCFGLQNRQMYLLNCSEGQLGLQKWPDILVEMDQGLARLQGHMVQ